MTSVRELFTKTNKREKQDFSCESCSHLERDTHLFDDRISHRLIWVGHAHRRDNDEPTRNRPILGGLQMKVDGKCNRCIPS